MIIIVASSSLSSIARMGMPIWAAEVPDNKSVAEKDLKKEIPKEETVVTSQSVQTLHGQINYKATVGTQLLNDEKGNAKASIFYIAYTKEGVDNVRERPITFCFNGGPGSSSVWLHLGAFGPRRVDIDEEGKSAKQPYHLVDNPYTLLDHTDLVFIDPVSTGYSRAVNGEDPKQFHAVDTDVQSVAEFIRLYVTRNLRWESPKFLAGESYGSTRAAGLAYELHDTQRLYLDGIILISSILDFQTISFSAGNDLPYALFLPSYTAAALYHGKLSEEYTKNGKKTLEDCEEFASGEYMLALMQGDLLDQETRQSIVKKLSDYTGLPPEYIEESNLRIPILRFAKQLMKDRKRVVGRFDTRILGIDLDICSSSFEYDPSLENVIGLFTATFNNYVRADLGWKQDPEYKILADIGPWDYGTATNQYLNVGVKLRKVMSMNPNLGVFVAEGYWDLATPYYAAEYTFAHLGLDPSIRGNVTQKRYDGGHMMFLYHKSLVQLKEDLGQFMKKLLDRDAGTAPPAKDMPEAR